MNHSASIVVNDHSARRRNGCASLKLDLRDINRDAKWCLLPMNEGPGGDVGAGGAA
jgi:hypothetical protein